MLPARHCRSSGRVARTLPDVTAETGTALRARAEAFVTREIEAHVPRLFRARAQVYIPLLVDRLVAFVELAKGDAP